MNKQNFLNLVRDPISIQAQDIAGLEEVIVSFPFCQAAHLLIAKGLRDYGSMHAEQRLKKAAAYSINRKRFKEIIQKNIKSDGLKKTEQLIIRSKEEALPIVKRIPEEQKSVIKTEKRRYEEIEENLKLIEFFKSEANKEPSESEKKEKEETFSAEITITNTEVLDTGAKVAVNDTPNNDSKEVPHFIYSSRMEDILLQELEIDSAHHKSDADLLLDYLDYIHENKLGKMRDKRKQKEIIEKFINADPVIPTLKPHTLPENQEDLASDSSRIHKSPLSETFARILSLQGKKDKAIEIYEQLILKFPEKKAYFATEIEKLKK